MLLADAKTILFDPSSETIISLLKIQGVPSSIQLATDGRWCNAWIIQTDKAPPLRRDIDSWMGIAGVEVAVEVFFGHPWETFVGFRLRPFPRATQISALHRLVGAITNRSWIDPSEVITGLETGLSLIQGSLFMGPPAFLEIGVVNNWDIYNSCEIWHRGETRPTLIDIMQRLTPSMSLPQPLPIAMEAAYKEPFPHWTGINVSTTVEGESCIDPLTIDRLVKLILSDKSKV